VVLTVLVPAMAIRVLMLGVPLPGFGPSILCTAFHRLVVFMVRVTAFVVLHDLGSFLVHHTPIVFYITHDPRGVSFNV
jgi:hypothetical protein